MDEMAKNSVANQSAKDAVLDRHPENHQAATEALKQVFLELERTP